MDNYIAKPLMLDETGKEIAEALRGFSSLENATLAMSAKEEAIVAQGLAETAQANAELAKQGAETARDEARTLAEGVASLTEIGVDTTLSISGAAADSKTVGDFIDALGCYYEVTMTDLAITVLGEDSRLTQGNTLYIYVPESANVPSGALVYAFRNSSTSGADNYKSLGFHTKGTIKKHILDEDYHHLQFFNNQGVGEAKVFYGFSKDTLVEAIYRAYHDIRTALLVHQGKLTINQEVVELTGSYVHHAGGFIAISTLTNKTLNFADTYRGARNCAVIRDSALMWVEVSKLETNDIVLYDIYVNTDGSYFVIKDYTKQIPETLPYCTGLRDTTLVYEKGRISIKPKGYIFTKYTNVNVSSLVNTEIDTSELIGWGAYFVVLRNRELVLHNTNTKLFEGDIILSHVLLNTGGAIDYVVWSADYYERLKVIEQQPDSNKDTCAIFARVCCCGDSYTSGHITLNGATVASNEKFAYPSFLARLTGNEFINCGHSGATVKTWQTVERGLPKAKNAGKVQAYLVALGINDSSGNPALGVELGTIDDIGTDNDTYYGGMSKIVRELSAISPLAKIFIMTRPVTGTVAESYNQACRDIVNAYKELYPVHLLDLYQYRDMYTNESLTGDSISGHYTAIGYQQFASILKYVWSDYINNHISDFQDVHLIPYD